MYDSGRGTYLSRMRRSDACDELQYKEGACSSPRQSIYPRVRPRHLFLPSLREGKHQSRDRQGPDPGACDKGKRGLRLSHCEHYDTEIRDGSPPLPSGILMAQRRALSEPSDHVKLAHKKRLRLAASVIRRNANKDAERGHPPRGRNDGASPERTRQSLKDKLLHVALPYR